MFWCLKITLTSLYQFFVEVRQLKCHHKSEKYVNGQNMGFTFLKWPKFGSFQGFGPIKSTKTHSMVFEINLTGIYQLFVEVRQLKRHHKGIN